MREEATAVERATEVAKLQTTCDVPVLAQPGVPSCRAGPHRWLSVSLTGLVAGGLSQSRWAVSPCRGVFTRQG